ncbi:MAG TPA: VanZ family protein, partial [Pyrinomonadaceae bacterium]|nr:VanZ family protein [Pyrinomonadaceae bacterium]
IGPLVLWLFPDTSPETMLTIHVFTRKIAHLTEYAILALLAARAFRGSSRVGLRARWLLASLVLIVVYALVDEYHQSFVPSRSASINDSLIDMIGGFAALFLVWRRDWFSSPQRRASNSPV